MQAIRHVFEQAPESIPVPDQWQRKRLEVILLVSEEEVDVSSASVTPVETGVDHWSADYFERTFGSIPDLPERETQLEDWEV